MDYVGATHNRQVKTSLFRERVEFHARPRLPDKHLRTFSSHHHVTSSVSIWINRKWLVFMTSSAWGQGEVCTKGHPTFYDARVNRLFQRISVSRTTKTVVDIYIYTSVSHEVSCLPVHNLIKQLKILKVTPISAYLNPIHSPIGHNLLHGCQCCPLDNLCQAVVSQTKGTSSKRIGWGTIL